MEENNPQNELPVKQPRRKNTKKFYVLAALALANVFTVSAASIAWFVMLNSKTDISAVSGDLNVQIDKVTAYKYVYPYYANSTTFINYDAKGPDSNFVKAYVVEDASVTGAGSANSTTFTLGVNDSSDNRVRTTASGATATNVHYEDSQDFRYYLLGDSTFTGVPDNAWSTLSALAFPQKLTIAGEVVAELFSVVISAGAEFVLFDSNTISAVPETDPVQYTSSYYTYDAITNDSPFSLEGLTNGKGTKIKCRKSGVYNFRFFYDAEAAKQKLTIEKNTGIQDDAIIGNNMLDPTKITIDHAGGKYHGTLQECLPEAIHDQNTMVVLDVALRYKNVNPVRAGLKVYRQIPGAENPATASHIYNLTDRYANTTAHKVGYIDAEHRNQLYASDFYAFYAAFAKDGLSGNAYATAAAAWSGLHLETDADDGGEPAQPYFTKFQNNGASYQGVIDDYTMFAKSGDQDDLIVPVSTGEGNLSETYHCYIAIDYDYEHINFFLNTDRLGKSYVLDRDFGFYFTAEQVLEGEEASA